MKRMLLTAAPDYLNDQVEKLRSMDDQLNPDDQRKACWEAGRDAALKEVADMAGLCPHLVKPLFIPAVEGLKFTLTAPAHIDTER